jgi:6-phosphogluconolactonase
VREGDGDRAAAPPTAEHFFDDRATMAAALAKEVAGDLRAAQRERSQATLAVPGGTTPRDFLRALRAETLDWSRTAVTLTDERWVPADHAESNERMVRAELETGPAARASWIALYTGHPDPESAREECERRLRPLLPFDVVVLGMGTDGHIASLFPRQAGLAAALDPNGDRLCGPARAPGSGAPRLSLHAPALLTARRTYLLIAGADKLAVFRDASAGANPAELPVAALREVAPPLHVYWAP